MSTMDNASVCSGQSATAATGMGMHRNIPRSSSTTDLFDTALPGAGLGLPRKRRPGAGLKHSASASSLDVRTVASNAKPFPRHARPLGPIPEARRAKLTPYQQQRRQMRNSFQFPNGENFTPKNRYMSKSSSTLSLASRTQSMGSMTPRTVGPMRRGMQGGMPGPMLRPMPGSMPGPMPGPMPGAIAGPTQGSTRTAMPRSQSLTSLRPTPAQLRGPLPRPLGHLSASPVNSTDSTVSSNSGSSVGSKATTVTTPERNVKTAFGPAFVPEAELEETRQEMGSGLEPIIEPKPEAMAIPKVEAKLEPAVEPRPESRWKQKLSRSVAEPAKKSAEPVELSNETVVPSDTPQPQGDTPEPTKSKLGKLFRKIFNSSTTGSVMRKRKRNQRDNSATPSSSSSPVLAPPPKARHRVAATAEGSPLSSPLGIGLAKDLNNNESPTNLSKSDSHEDWQMGVDGRKASLTASLDTEDDVLMDTDLVFDSLLLKANSSSTSSWKRQQDLQSKLQALASPKKSQEESDTGLRKQMSEENDPNIDYELVLEFSKLGSYIETPGASPTRGSFPTLPQRSPKRPTLPNKHLAKSFYDQDYSDSKLIKRLQENWNAIHFDSMPPVTTNGLIHKKSLRFAQDIYVKDTWSPQDYHRSDKNFIKDRRRMMQLENSGFINAIKRELNEYKRHEMTVHGESTKFTHFFV